MDADVYLQCESYRKYSYQATMAKMGSTSTKLKNLNCQQQIPNSSNKKIIRKKHSRALGWTEEQQFLLSPGFFAGLKCEWTNLKNHVGPFQRRFRRHRRRVRQKASDVTSNCCRLRWCHRQPEAKWRRCQNQIFSQNLKTFLQISAAKNSLLQNDGILRIKSLTW